MCTEPWRCAYRTEPKLLAVGGGAGQADDCVGGCVGNGPTGISPHEGDVVCAVLVVVGVGVSSVVVLVAFGAVRSESLWRRNRSHSVSFSRTLEIGDGLGL